MAVIPRIIVAAIDLGVTSKRALDHAAALAAKLDAELHVVHAVHAPLELTRAGRERTRASLDQLAIERRADLERIVAPYRSTARIGQLVVEVGHPDDVISACARDLHADLVVVGSHGRTGFLRTLLGSIAADVTRATPCPVLTVPTKAA